MVDGKMILCVSKGCGRDLAAPVRFCPYCAMAQPEIVPVVTQPALSPLQDSGAEASKPGQTIASLPVVQPEGKLSQPVQGMLPELSDAPQGSDTPVKTSSEDGSNSPPPPPPPPPPGKAKWLVLGLMVLAVFTYYFKDKNDSQRKQEEQTRRENQAGAAITLAQACKLDQARTNLGILDAMPGTPAQRAAVQKAITESSVRCARENARAQAWTKVVDSVEQNLKDKGFDKAKRDIKIFDARWNQDAASRELFDKVDSQQVNFLLDTAENCLKRGDFACTMQNLGSADRMDRPDTKVRIATLREELSKASTPPVVVAPPAPAPMQAPAPSITPAPRPAPVVVAPAPRPQVTSQPAPVQPSPQETDNRSRNFYNEAMRRIRQGNYNGAIDQLDVCLSLDPANNSCQTLRRVAEEKNKSMLRCVSNGQEWRDDRCL